MAILENPITSGIKAAGKILDELFTSDEERGQLKNKRLEIEARLHEIDLEGQRLKLEADKAYIERDMAQAEINKEDAKSGKWWQAGWRPFMGWTCGWCLFWHFFLAQFFGIWWKVPTIDDAASLFAITTALLGVGTLRTVEKIKKRA